MYTDINSIRLFSTSISDFGEFSAKKLGEASGYALRLVTLVGLANPHLILRDPT